MARWKKKKKKGSGLTSAKSLRNFAFQFGLVTKGLKNPGSQIPTVLTMA